MLSRRARWGVGFVVWAAIGLLLTLELYLSLGQREGTVSLASVAFGQFMRALFWAALTPLVLWLQRHAAIGRENWHWAVPIHLTLSVALMGFIYLARLFIAFVYCGEDLAEYWESASRSFYGRNLLDIPLYWAVYGTGYTIGLFRRFQQSQIRSAQLESDLAQAEMKALKA